MSEFYRDGVRYFCPYGFAAGICYPVPPLPPRPAAIGQGFTEVHWYGGNFPDCLTEGFTRWALDAYDRAFKNPFDLALLGQIETQIAAIQTQTAPGCADWTEALRQVAHYMRSTQERAQAQQAAAQQAPSRPLGRRTPSGPRASRTAATLLAQVRVLQKQGGPPKFVSVLYNQYVAALARENPGTVPEALVPALSMTTLPTRPRPFPF